MNAVWAGPPAGTSAATLSIGVRFLAWWSGTQAVTRGAPYTPARWPCGGRRHSLSKQFQYTDVREYATARAALLDRLLHLLQADRRVVAAWLEGSFGRDAADDWSDLDLHVAVADDRLTAFLEQADQLFGRLGTVVLRYDEPRNAPPDGVFALVVYQGALEVDWSIGPLRTARRPQRARLLFERAGIPIAAWPPPPAPAQRRQQAARRVAFFWAMAPTALKYVGRGQTARSVSLITLLTEALIHVWRLVHVPDGPDPARFTPDRLLEPELAAHLPRLGRKLDSAQALTVIRGLCAEMIRLHPAVAALGAPVPQAAFGEIAALADLAERTAEGGWVGAAPAAGTALGSPAAGRP